ncbi:hypothetical protein QCA50_017327 [Cerrena zonata]|uniref:Enoyl reductase (ER) domain-containing protein n=1 Tax=Cerrena zonata TaxID=2478898 RepID=A0AAW0FFT0_9APHY
MSFHDKYPRVKKIASIEVPKPQAGELLVRVEAVALNPIDWKAHEWGISIAQYPAILGCEVSGVVVQVGPEVNNRAIGDVIAFQSYPGETGKGGFQQFAIVEAAVTFEVPSNMSHDEASTLPACALTAVHAFYTDYIPTHDIGGANLVPFWKEGGKYAGTPIVVFGGASSNGQFAIQLARLSGLSPIIATASPHNEGLLKSLGATHVVNRNLTPTDLKSTIQEITSKPIQLIYDAIATEETQNLAYDVLKSGGKLLLALPSVIDQTKITSDKQVLHFVGKTYLPGLSAIDKEFYAVLPTYLKSGDIKPLIPESLPGGLHSISEGLGRLKRNELTARKLIVHPTETI